jgi:hypothetical protein
VKHNGSVIGSPWLYQLGGDLILDTGGATLRKIRTSQHDRRCVPAVSFLIKVMG